MIIFYSLHALSMAFSPDFIGVFCKILSFCKIFRFFCLHRHLFLEILDTIEYIYSLGKGIKPLSRADVGTHDRVDMVGL